MSRNRSIAEQHANACVYFNGIQNEKCEAGIAYPKDWKLNPCHKDNISIPCNRRSFPTPEEVKSFVEECEKQFENMGKAFQLTAKIKKEHKGKDWQGVEICPACGGKLHLSHAALNGHVWGKCETEKCLAWLE
jgi:hypothetical protein